MVLGGMSFSNFDGVYSTPTTAPLPRQYVNRIRTHMPMHSEAVVRPADSACGLRSILEALIHGNPSSTRIGEDTGARFRAQAVGEHRGYAGSAFEDPVLTVDRAAALAYGHVAVPRHTAGRQSGPGRLPDCGDYPFERLGGGDAESQRL